LHANSAFKTSAAYLAIAAPVAFNDFFAIFFFNPSFSKTLLDTNGNRKSNISHVVNSLYFCSTCAPLYAKLINNEKNRYPDLILVSS